MKHTWKLLLCLIEYGEHTLLHLCIFLCCQPHFKKLLIEIFEFLQPGRDVFYKLLNELDSHRLRHALEGESHITWLDIDCVFAVAIHVVIDAVVIVALVHWIFVFLSVYLESIFCSRLFLAARIFLGSLNWFDGWRWLFKVFRAQLSWLYFLALSASFSILLLRLLNNLFFFLDLWLLLDKRLKFILYLLVFKALLSQNLGVGRSWPTFILTQGL